MRTGLSLPVPSPTCPTRPSPHVPHLFSATASKRLGGWGPPRSHRQAAADPYALRPAPSAVSVVTTGGRRPAQSARRRGLRPPTVGATTCSALLNTHPLLPTAAAGLLPTVSAGLNLFSTTRPVAHLLQNMT